MTPKQEAAQLITLAQNELELCRQAVMADNFDAASHHWEEGLDLLKEGQLVMNGLVG